MAAELRFSLDKNLLVYLVARDDPARKERAQDVFTRAGRTGRCTLSVQTMGEFYIVAVLKRLASPAEAQALVGDFMSLFPVVAPIAADVRVAIAAAGAGRFSYWDALLLSTLGRTGCSVVLSEDMGDNSTLGGATVRNPFTGSVLPQDLAALLS